MSNSPDFTKGECELDAVIVTEQLAGRTSRKPDHAFETQSLLKLNRDLSVSPETFFQKLVDAALKLSHAESTGISLLNEEHNCFVWPAVAGGLSPFLWQVTPINFGPCGTVLERNTSLLMQHPERHFAYLAPITPPLEEVLLIPFYMDGKAVGTIWAVIHTKGEYFDAEDKRLLESLSDFAAAAYKTLVKAGGLKPLLRPVFAT